MQSLQGILVFLTAAVVFVGMPAGFSMGSILTRARPNEEIWRPLKALATVGVVILLLEALIPAKFPAFEKYLFFVNLFAVAFGLRLGGLAFMQHFTLRLILWRKRYAPRDCVGFFRHAAELTFLRRVGGGYLFMHRRLLDHLAAMDTPAPHPDPRDA